MEQQGREGTKPATPERMLGEAPVIHPGAQVSECRLGAWTEIGAGWTLIETDFGDYSYAAGTDGVTRSLSERRRAPCADASLRMSLAASWPRHGGIGIAPRSRRDGVIFAI